MAELKQDDYDIGDGVFAKVLTDFKKAGSELSSNEGEDLSSIWLDNTIEEFKQMKEDAEIKKALEKCKTNSEEALKVLLRHVMMSPQMQNVKAISPSKLVILRKFMMSRFEALLEVNPNLEQSAYNYCYNICSSFAESYNAAVKSKLENAAGGEIGLDDVQIIINSDLDNVFSSQRITTDHESFNKEIKMFNNSTNIKFLSKSKCNDLKSLGNKMLKSIKNETMGVAFPGLDSLILEANLIAWQLTVGLYCNEINHVMTTHCIPENRFLGLIKGNYWETISAFRPGSTSALTAELAIIPALESYLDVSVVIIGDGFVIVDDPTLFLTLTGNTSDDGNVDVCHGGCLKSRVFITQNSKLTIKSPSKYVSPLRKLIESLLGLVHSSSDLEIVTEPIVREHSARMKTQRVVFNNASRPKNIVRKRKGAVIAVDADDSVEESESEEVAAVVKKVATKQRKSSNTKVEEDAFLYEDEESIDFGDEDVIEEESLQATATSSRSSSLQVGAAAATSSRSSNLQVGAAAAAATSSSSSNLQVIAATIKSSRPSLQVTVDSSTTAPKSTRVSVQATAAAESNLQVAAAAAKSSSSSVQATAAADSSLKVAAAKAKSSSSLEIDKLGAWDMLDETYPFDSITPVFEDKDATHAVVDKNDIMYRIHPFSYVQDTPDFQYILEDVYIISWETVSFMFLNKKNQYLVLYIMEVIDEV